MQTITWTEYEPVYMTQAEFKNAVQLEAPRELNEPGKIYFYEGYLFVNEVNEGIHIIDNRDPASPVKVGFINIPANKDMAVRGNYLYADSHSDLLVFDISDLQKPELVTRKENVFEHSADEPPGYPAQPVDRTMGVVVDWKPVQRTEVCEGDCSNARWGWESTIGIGGVLFSSADVAGGAAGVGGSMARFAIAGAYLYTVDDSKLTTFDISAPEPNLTSQKDVGWAIETIFPHEQNLFIGSQSAMYIYDISDPAVPVQFSVYNHITSCDPVVVEGDYAYVTLRETERCPRGVNRLEIIDISDKTKPSKVATYEMISPHGLGVDGGYLFISEGDHGLKIFDAKDPLNVRQLDHITDIKTFDVIPYKNVLMVTGKSGITQFDYSNINDLKHLSTIPVDSEE
jgi:hypothetical protein